MQADRKSSLENLFITVAEDLKTRRGEGVLASLREKGSERFWERGIPSRKEELYRSIPLHKLETASWRLSLPSFESVEIKSHLLKEAKNSYFTFFQGNLSLKHSDRSALPKEVEILPLEEAVKTYSSFLQGRWKKMLREERDAFTLFQLATVQEALFIYIPPQCSVEMPLQLLLLGNEERGYNAPVVYLFMGKESELTLIETVATRGFTNSLFDITLDEGAKLSHIRCLKGQQEPFFASVRGEVKKSASYEATTIHEEGVFERSNFEISLVGEGASADLHGVWKIKEEGESHTQVTIHHKAPHTISMQRFKGILEGDSISSFEGKIVVAKEAQKTEAYQRSHALLLSPRAKAISKPNLAIFADDVKASHGATVATVDEDQLFYLQSRGVSLEEGKKLLVNGILEEALARISAFSHNE